MHLSEDLLVGAEEAARFTGLTKRTIYHLVERNEIPHRKIGSRLYFRKSALDISFSGTWPSTSGRSHNVDQPAHATRH